MANVNNNDDTHTMAPPVGNLINSYRTASTLLVFLLPTDTFLLPYVIVIAFVVGGSSIPTACGWNRRGR